MNPDGGVTVNRIEIIATFSAIQKLLKNKCYSDVEEVVQEVLAEARGETKKEPSKEKDAI